MKINLSLLISWGFKPDDSCIDQLLAITHEIYKSLDDGFEVRNVFLDISKAVDKVWHEGLIFKIKKKVYLAIYSIFYETF